LVSTAKYISDVSAESDDGKVPPNRFALIAKLLNATSLERIDGMMLEKLFDERDKELN